MVNDGKEGGGGNRGKEWGKGVNCAKVRGGEGGMNGEGKISLPFNYIHRLITYSRFFFVYLKLLQVQVNYICRLRQSVS